MSVPARMVSFGMKPGKPTTNKFRNRPTIVDGMQFHSKKEAKRYQALQLLARNGEIKDIERQVKYRLEVNGILICTYAADFVYWERVSPDKEPGHSGLWRWQTGDKWAWQQVVEDVKGYPNDRWPMKKKLMRACHRIEIRES